jgi:hypothetical protein
MLKTFSKKKTADNTNFDDNGMIDDWIKHELLSSERNVKFEEWVLQAPVNFDDFMKQTDWSDLPMGSDTVYRLLDSRKTETTNTETTNTETTNNDLLDYVSKRDIVSLMVSDNERLSVVQDLINDLDLQHSVQKKSNNPNKEMLASLLARKNYHKSGLDNIIEPLPQKMEEAKILTGLVNLKHFRKSAIKKTLRANRVSFRVTVINNNFQTNIGTWDNYKDAIRAYDYVMEKQKGGTLFYETINSKKDNETFETYKEIMGKRISKKGAGKTLPTFQPKSEPNRTKQRNLDKAKSSRVL